jgi:hypothetical protein
LTNNSSSSSRAEVEPFISKMEQERPSKLRRFANYVAVQSEPGLTNAQLMLTNFDLKPG